MASDDQNQKGGQQNAEGQHGAKTHAAFIQDLQSGRAEDGDGIPERGAPYGATESDGRHRLTEEREQHDEAEKNSELRKTKGSDPAR